MQSYSGNLHFPLESNQPQFPEKKPIGNKKNWLKEVMSQPMEDCTNSCKLLDHVYKINPNKKSAVHNAMVNVIMQYEYLDSLHAHANDVREEVKGGMGHLHQMASRLGGSLESERVLEKTNALLVKHFKDYLQSLEESGVSSDFGSVFLKHLDAIESRLSKSDKGLFKEIKTLFIQRDEKTAKQKLLVLAKKNNLAQLSNALQSKAPEGSPSEILASAHLSKDPGLSRFLLCAQNSSSLCLELHSQLNPSERKKINPTQAKEIVECLESKRFDKFLEGSSEEDQKIFAQFLANADESTHSFISYLMDHNVSLKNFNEYIQSKINNKQLLPYTRDELRNKYTSKSNLTPSPLQLLCSGNSYFIKDFAEMYRGDHLDWDHPGEHDAFAWMLMNRKDALAQRKSFSYVDAHTQVPFKSYTPLHQEVLLLLLKPPKSQLDESQKEIRNQLLAPYRAAQFNIPSKEERGPYQHEITGDTYSVSKRKSTTYDQSTHHKPQYSLTALLQKNTITGDTLKYAFESEFSRAFEEEVKHPPSTTSEKAALSMTSGAFNDLIESFKNSVKNQDITYEDATKVLKSKVANQVSLERQKEQKIDRDTFKDLLGMPEEFKKAKQNLDLDHPTVKQYADDVKNGTWPENEWRVLPHFLKDEDFNASFNALKKMWDDPNFKEVLTRYFKNVG